MTDAPNSPRTLPEWLARIETLHPREIDLGLDRVRTVAQALGLFRSPLASQVITVAGTNGKGSCVHLLEQQCLAAGRRVVSYTSPHLVRYNERVRIDGQPVSDQALCTAFGVVEAARGACPLTYFEYGTLAALLLAREAAPEVLLLEVGMGGRLDAVNVIDADIAVLTSVALDHCEWLGETREQIGAEKAGIFRPGCPAVCADAAPPDSVRRQAARVGTGLRVLGEDFHLEPDKVDRWEYRGSDGQGRPVARSLAPPPEFPLPVIAATLLVCDLAGWPVQEAALSARLPGRGQRLECGGREFLLDVAHNLQATTALAARVAGLPPRDGETVGVIALLAGRDIVGITRPLWPYVARWRVAGTTGARGCSAEEQSRILAGAGQDAEPISGPDLLGGLLAGTRAGDRIVVFGSFQLLGELLTPDLNQLRESEPWTG